MRSPAFIHDYVLRAIGDVYRQPLMYADSAAGMETVLHLYHDLWAVVVGREAEYRDARSRIQAEEVANADLFSNNYARTNPRSTEAERAEYAIMRWKTIDRILGLEVP
jgi:hypothetical protein